METPVTNVTPSMPTLLMAVVAPFVAIAALAVPLLFDALKHAVGL